MAFDQSTRARLQRFVSDARALLTEEFTRQMQHEYGLNPASGEVADLKTLKQLDDSKRQTAKLLREMLEHYQATNPSSDRITTIERIVREQAFTVLNRLCALRMAESRGLLIESIGNGYQSKGFQLYARLAGTAFGETGDAYQCYVFGLFDEFALDLAVLFDRFSPSGRLFPRESALLQLLEQINHPDIDALWTEDETIGWIYQYFNSKEERKKMRDESAAPRNSRELAVRNQFFTPRYVVEFLTDNTLGRIWHEMTQGKTSLKDNCRYLVRRPDEVYLSERTDPNSANAYPECVRLGELLQTGTADSWPEFDGREESRESLIAMHMCVDGELQEKDQWEFCDRVLKPQNYAGISTRDLFDGIYFQGRSDRHGDGTLFDQPWYVSACNEIRRRALESGRSDLTQEQLLNQPFFIPQRLMKDPRELRMLDPACGSMHFGLYAFDLFERIYEEAWDLGCRGSLTDDYSTKEAFLRDIPRLIIEHNIHGIDIDPRAVQIAGLSLWLRAQKSWQTRGVKPQARPQIRRSHIVCAEPMPGESAFLEEFIAQHLTGDPEREFLADLVRKVFESMELAGDAGSLLKIEEEIASEVAKAKRQWVELPKKKQRVLFAPPPKLVQKELDLVKGIADESFWDEAEERIYDALRAYAERTEIGGRYQRRLFADDAARGFAFIDICRKRYDVTLMNPPFGDPVSSVRDLLTTKYRIGRNDLYTAMVLRGASLTHQYRGFVGAITSRSFLTGRDHRDFRRFMIDDQNSCLRFLLDLGAGVLDGAGVETAAYVVGPVNDACITFFDVRGANGESVPINSLTTSSRRIIPRILFSGQATAEILYGLDETSLRGMSNSTYLDPTIAKVTFGITTKDNFRFVRLRWEVPENEIGDGKLWTLFSKGGEYSWFSADTHLVVNRSNNGSELAAVAALADGNIASTRRSSSYYFKPSLTFSRRSQKGFSVRRLRTDVCFSDAGGAIIPNDQGEEWSLCLLALLTTTEYISVIKAQST